MSMLIRTGTLVRKPRSIERKSSGRKTRSSGGNSSYPQSQGRCPDDEDAGQWSSVPPSPVTKFQGSPGDHTSLMSSPGKSSVGTTCTTTTVVSLNEGRTAYQTSIDGHHDSCDVVSHSTGHQTITQIEDAKKEADNLCDFLCTASKIVCSSTFVRSLVIMSMIVPVVMIALGVKYLDDCPLEPRIPVFLLVGGCFWLLKIVICLWKSLQRRHNGSIDNLYSTSSGESAFHSATYRAMETLLTLFLVSWHVLGSVWTLAIWRPRFTPLLHQPDAWCEQSLYLYTVAIIIGGYALMTLWLLGMICLACVYRANSGDDGGGL